MVSIAALACVLPAKAETLAYTDGYNTNLLVYNPSLNLALTFDVNTPVSVTALGVFNASGSGTITGPVEVAIFQDSGAGTQVTPTVTFAGNYTPVGSGYDVVQTITAVILQPGAYLVDEWGLNTAADPAGDQYYGSIGPTLNDGGGLLTFTGALADYTGAFDNPFLNGDACSGCATAPAVYSEFDAGTFEFSATIVPEPSSFLLTVAFLGILSCAIGRRFRRRI